MTAVVIVLFMPEYSYWAAAYGHLASYLVMFAISAILGAKYYPIPYRWGRLAGIVLLMGAVYGVSLVLDRALFENAALLLKLGAHTVLILAYIAGAWKIVTGK